MTNTAATGTPVLPYRDTRYLDALKERVLVFDGAMGTNIQRYNLTADDFGGRSLEGCNDLRSAPWHPDALDAIRRPRIARSDIASPTVRHSACRHGR